MMVRNLHDVKYGDLKVRASAVLVATIKTFYIKGWK